eukprot:1117952-Amphidinium_carterae.1
MELAGLRKGSPSPLFKIFMPSFGQPVATLYGLEGFDHTLTVTDNPAGLAFLQSRTTAKSSALNTDCLQPGRASQDLSPVSVI